MKIVKRFLAFLKKVREELSQVTWPTRDELIGSAMVVFVGVVLMGSFIAVCDIMLSQAATLLLQ